MKKSITRKQIFVVIALLLLIAFFCVWQNNDLTVSTIQYRNELLPESFDGYRILQVSDLHNKEFGKHQERLIALTKTSRPDIIVITGDLLDSRHPGIEAAMEYVDAAVQIAPVYFVAGNQEGWSGKYADLSARLTNAGVIVLDNQSVVLTKDGKKITLVGIQDPAFFDSESSFEDALTGLADPEDFTVLLSHRPEKMALYANDGFDLVFAGHAHGGQFRLPGLGGLYAPDQGFFPKYTSGKYTDGDTSMVVSRGLGNSVIPLRLFNRPELVLVILSQ